MNKKKIFITGGNGFLGRHLIPILKKKNLVIFPSSKQVNLMNFNDLKKFTTNFDEIYHLAAWTQAGDFCLSNEGSQWVNNQIMNSNIIKWWSAYQKKAKLIFIGSSCCYSEQGDLKEDKYIHDIPHDSLMSYAMTKQMLTQGAIACAKQYNLKWLCLVPPTLYGVNYHTDNKRQSHFIFDLIKKILRGKFYNEKVVLWGDGYQKRELMYVNDFVKNILLINKKINNQIVNLGSKRDYSIREFAKIISKIVGYNEQNIIYDINKYVGVRKKKLNTQKIKKIITNYEKKLTDIKIGLKEVVNWYLKNNVYNA
jgi:GDP-L-fucose synthase